MKPGKNTTDFKVKKLREKKLVIKLTSSMSKNGIITFQVS